MKRIAKSIVLRLLWQAVALKVKLERPTVIAITGTVGKTSAKEAVAAVLAGSGRPVVKTFGNLNSETGVALSLLGFTEAPRSLLAWLKVVVRCLIPPVKPSRTAPLYVLEFSADHKGDIGFLSKKFALDAAVITAITPVHMEYYPQFEDLVVEKFSIAGGLRPGGTLFLNADDRVQVEYAKDLKNIQVSWYGVGQTKPKRVGAWCYDPSYEEQGLAASFCVTAAKKMDGVGHDGIGGMRITTRLIGRHQLYSLVIAVALANLFKAAPEEIRKAVGEYESPAGRGRLIEGIKDILLVDDSYNASPATTKAGLAMLREVANGRRVVAVLGNMNELGDLAAQSHAEVGEYAVGKVDFLVAVGKNAETLVKAAKHAGHSGHMAMSFSSTEALIYKIDQIVERKDLVYIRGSQNGVYLERLVKRLMAHPDQAAERLVRQSRYWYDKHSK